LNGDENGSGLRSEEDNSTESVLVLDPAWQTASWRGQLVKLTPTQFALLEAMARQPGRPVSKAVLLEDVWGYAEYDPNVVEVQIAGLRKRLRELDSDLVSTVRSLGYVINVVSLVKGGRRVGGGPPPPSDLAKLVELSRATAQAARVTREHSQRLCARSAETRGRVPRPPAAAGGSG